jgi:peptide methionine sulfoxide reductase msrA/msrB
MRLQDLKFTNILQRVNVVILLSLAFSACNGQPTQNKNNQTVKKMETGIKLNTLSEDEKRVILGKGTDRPFTGEYTDKITKGMYVCRQCDAPLYTSDSKFHSNCGWPSFDDEIKGAVTKTVDADGRRTEITCAKCGGHLGHVFYGEGLTDKDTRHCVNTSSLKFVDALVQTESAKAIFAGGCFWGVEYYFQHEKGVLNTTVGYTGGTKLSPTYEEVLSHTTGHYEAIEVEFDPSVTNYETLAKLFFEIHDPTQANGQGNDIGQQYQSVVFYVDDTQKASTEKLIAQLRTKGFDVATKLIKASKFWPAEGYHQEYYEKGGGEPYCHHKVKRF